MKSVSFGKKIRVLKLIGAFNNQEGVALIVVLWVSVLLTVMVNGFITMVRTEASSVSNYKTQTEAYYLAKSGINLAIEKIRRSLETQATTSAVDEEPIDRWFFDGRVRRGSLWKGQVDIRIIDEGGKIDVNKASRTDLVRILLSIGMEGTERDEIVDSILDWRDENNFHRLNGAEDDYYRSLPDPYESKDGPLSTTDELMWIKGITPEIFYGKQGQDPSDVEGAGLMNVFTVFTNSVRVNVNTASLAVLRSLPGQDTEAAMGIIEAREEKEIQSLGDFIRAGGIQAPNIGRNITYKSPGVYTIMATGFVEGNPIRHAVKAVVKITKNKLNHVLYWKDQDRVQEKK